LDPQESLNALGLDSLMALELQHALETTLHVRLPIELLLGAPSLDDFVDRLLEVVLKSEPETAPEESSNWPVPAGSDL
jgi:acyl carrier protein